MAAPFELKFDLNVGDAVSTLRTLRDGLGGVGQVIGEAATAASSMAEGFDTFTSAAQATAQAIVSFAEASGVAVTAEEAESAELSQLTELLGSEAAARASLAATIIDMTVAQESATVATEASARVTAEATASTRSYAAEMTRSAAAAMEEGAAQQTAGERLNTRLAGLRRFSEAELAARRTAQATEEGIAAFAGKSQELGSMLTMLGLLDPQLLRAGVGVQMLGQAAETLGPKIVEAGAGVAGFAAVLGPIALIGAGIVVTMTAIATAAVLVGSALKAGIGEQESETTFAVLLGNVEKAKARLEELDQTALKFHLDPEEVRSASAQLTRLSQGALGAGESLNTVIEISARSGRSLTDVGAIIGRLYETIQSGQPVGRMATQLVRMGAISASDVNALNNLHKEGAKGPEVWAAAEAALNKYSGAAEARANTFEGATKGIETAWELVLEAFGKPIADALTPLLQRISALVVSLVPKAKEAGQEIKAAVDTIYGLVQDGTLGERLENNIDVGIDQAALYTIQQFREAYDEIVDIFKHPINFFFSPSDQKLLDKFANFAGGSNASDKATFDPEGTGYSTPASQDGPAASAPDDRPMEDQLKADMAAKQARNAQLDKEAQERGKKDLGAPNSGTEFTPVTPGDTVEPDGKSNVAQRTKEVNEGKEAEKEYKDALESTKGMLEAGDLSQTEATAQNIKTTQDYIAHLQQLQASMDPASEKYQKMTAEINEARASLLKLAEGQEEFQATLDLTKSKLEAGIVTQSQADKENNATITAQIARLRQLQTTVNQTSAAWEALETKINNLTVSQQQTTALGQITATFHKVINEWGDLGKNASQWLSSTMNAGVSSVSQGLTGLITKTGDWKQTFDSAINSMLEGLIELGVKEVLHFAMTGSLMSAQAALGITTQESVTTAQVASGAAIAAAHAPAAAATSVSSYGVSAIVGAALAVAAIGAIIALLAGGFAEGGLIPGAPSHSDNRIAKVATGEFVIRTAAVQHWGPEFFENLNNFRFPITVPAYAAGGLVGGGAAMALAGGSRDRAKIVNQVSVGGTKVTLVQPNTQHAMREVMRSAEGDTIIIDAIHRNKHRLPFKK